MLGIPFPVFSFGFASAFEGTSVACHLVHCCFMRSDDGWCWCPTWVCSDCSKARSRVRLEASIPSLGVYMVLEFTLNSLGHLEFLWHPSVDEASSSRSWQSSTPLSVTEDASLNVGGTWMGVWAHVWFSSCCFHLQLSFINCILKENRLSVESVSSCLLTWSFARQTLFECVHTGSSIYSINTIYS